MVRVHIFVKHIRLGPISSGDFKKNEHVEDHKENNKNKVGSSVLVGNCPQHCSVGLPCCVPSCLRHKVDHHRTGGGQDRPLLQTSSSFSTLSPSFFGSRCPFFFLSGSGTLPVLPPRPRSVPADGLRDLFGFTTPLTFPVFTRPPGAFLGGKLNNFFLSDFRGKLFCGSSPPGLSGRSPTGAGGEVCGCDGDRAAGLGRNLQIGSRESAEHSIGGRLLLLVTPLPGLEGCRPAAGAGSVFRPTHSRLTGCELQ